MSYPKKEKEESYKATVSTEISSTSFARSYVAEVAAGDPGVNGDYYTKNGEYLGTDGKDDDKVYVAESVTKNKNGVVTVAQNSRLLTNHDGTNVSHVSFRRMAGKIANEDNSSEDVMMALGSAMGNIMKRDNWTVSDMVNAPDYAYASGTFDSQESDENKRIAFKSAINSISGGFDYSYGAIRWDGVDFAEKGLDHNIPKNGFFIHAEHFRTFSDNWSDEAIAAIKTGRKNALGYSLDEFWKKSRPRTNGYFQLGSKPSWNEGWIRFESTTVIGKTIYWKEVNINVQGSIDQNVVEPLQKWFNNRFLGKE